MVWTEGEPGRTTGRRVVRASEGLRGPIFRGIE
jgi:hypothetical protein